MVYVGRPPAGIKLPHTPEIQNTSHLLINTVNTKGLFILKTA